MTAINRARSGVLLGIVGVTAAGALFGLAGAGAASATVVPLDIPLGQLVPGVTSSGSATLDVPMRARVTSTGWSATDDEVTWDARLCSVADGCTSLEQLAAGPPIAAGRYTVTVSATLPENAAATGDMAFRASGSITMIEADPASSAHALASTGAGILWWLIPTALVAAVIGAVLVAVARRRREDVGRHDETDPDERGGK